MESTFLRKRMHQRPAGFTLLELLVVIAIIGVLVSVGVVSYSSAQKKSRDSRRRVDVKAMQMAWEQYYVDNDGDYPSTCSTSMTTYLPSGLPTDPKTGSAYSKTCSATAYCFCATMENTGSGNSATTDCTFPAGSKNYFCVKNLQ